MNKVKNKNQKGFLLIGLLIVAAIIAILFVMISPDEGASYFTENAQGHQSHILKKTRKESRATGGKTGIHAEIHTVEGEADVARKNICILDDIIDTGGTIIRVIEHLKSLGAKKVIVGATHGIFSGGKVAEKILKSSCSHIFITDAILSSDNPKVEIIKLSKIK